MTVRRKVTVAAAGLALGVAALTACGGSAPEPSSTPEQSEQSEEPGESDEVDEGDGDLEETEPQPDIEE